MFKIVYSKIQSKVVPLEKEKVVSSTNTVSKFDVTTYEHAGEPLYFLTPIVDFIVSLEKCDKLYIDVRKEKSFMEELAKFDPDYDKSIRYLPVEALACDLRDLRSRIKPYRGVLLLKPSWVKGKSRLQYVDHQIFYPNLIAIRNAN